MRILVTGANGQLAHALAECGRGRALDVAALGRPMLDVTDAASIERAITRLRPDIVVNPAAFTQVDRAESEPDAAFSVNRDGAENVAKAARRAGIPLIHLSTDYVFDGTAPRPYREDDPVAPAGVYGRSKLAGELAVAAANPDHAILRTAWVFAPDGANFVRTMLRLATERDEIAVVDDQIGCPTYAPDLADAVLSLCAGWNEHRPHGIYHAAGTGETSWCGLAAAVFAGAAARGRRPARARPIPSSDYPTPARRPMNSRLDCTRLSAETGIALPSWQDGLERCLDRLVGPHMGDVI